MSSYTDTERHAIAEAGKFDADDILAFGPHYFSCGWKRRRTIILTMRLQ